MRLQLPIGILPTIDDIEPNTDIPNINETATCLRFDNETSLCDTPDLE